MDRFKSRREARTKDFSVGERILATWADGRKYPAKVNAVLGNGKRSNLNYISTGEDLPIAGLTFLHWTSFCLVPDIWCPFNTILLLQIDTMCYLTMDTRRQLNRRK